MFFKKIKNNLFMLILTILIIPEFVLAYSSHIIAGGENIGIELNSKGVIIVGTYEVDGKNPAKEAGLNTGDKIIEINNNSINSINDMLSIIENDSNKSNIIITYQRGNKKDSTTLNLVKEDDNIYKTGLYVKDSITGVGTLTFIDPNTKLFGALGHEITESTTGKILEIADGSIFDSTVIGITPSSDGEPGEKNATFNIKSVDGNILKNTNKGIFGEYTNSINNNNNNIYKVANLEDINLGNAKILTVLDGDKIGEYSINILKVSNTKDHIKNIMFEITDEDLLKKTNGIIQGMSGSPIIQNDYIIGAVTHVVVDNPHKGYGILITNMLEEAEN